MKRLSAESKQDREGAGDKGMNSHRELVYENPWSRLGPVFFTGVLVLISGIFLSVLWINWFHAEGVPFFYKIVVTAGCAWGGRGIWFYFQGYLYTAARIGISSTAVKSIGLYKQEWVIRFDDVLSVETAQKFDRTVIVTGADDVRIQFNDYVNSFGHIVETVLDRAENVKVVDIDDLIENTRKDRKNEGWQKEVNYEIIDRAKARAEENRKKMESIIHEH